jgi:putative acyl-CoA dehydrogenase
MCLDVLRAFGKSAATREVVLHELDRARGRNRNFDAALERFAAAVEAPAPAEGYARRFTQMFVTLMQGSLLLSGAADSGAHAMAEGFCATRLDADSGWGTVFGANSATLDVHAIMDRAWVEN